MFDEQHRRDEAKRAYEKEMIELKLAQERELFEMRLAHEREMMRLRLSAGLPPEDEREIPGFNMRVTAQGERINPKDPDDDIH